MNRHSDANLWTRKMIRTLQSQVTDPTHSYRNDVAIEARPRESLKERPHPLWLRGFLGLWMLAAATGNALLPQNRQQCLLVC